MTDQCQLNLSVESNGSTPGFPDEDIARLHTMEMIHRAACHVYSWTTIVTGVIGAVENIVTILVFRKIGFSKSIDISYTALAFSDLLCVLAILLNGVEKLSEKTSEAISETGEHMASGISRITCLLTAWISFERCMSVTFPARVKLIITRRFNSVALVAIFLIVFAAPLVIVAARGFAMLDTALFNNLSATHNICESEEVKEARKVVFVLHGAIIPLSTWLCVAVCTTVLIVKLRASTKWRRQVAHTRTMRQDRIELRVTKKVIAIAFIFLVSSAPFSGSIFVTFLRQYNLIFMDRSRHHLHHIILMIGMWMTQLNSSINLLVFALMGRQFRKHLYQMFSRSKKDHP